MAATAVGVVAAHRSLGTPSEIVRDRRTVFRAVASTLRSPLVDAADDVLDGPLVRGRLGAAFVGSSAPPDAAAVLADLVAAGFAETVRETPVRLASTTDAPRLLDPAVRQVTETLRAHGDTDSTPLIVAGGRAARAYPMLLAGIELAFEVAPDLAATLLPHVALFAVTDRSRSGRLGSASDRDHPGLILLPEPRSAVEVAEAFVHEGSHCAFFDAAVTHDVLAAGHWAAAPFRPSWLAADAPAWPMEQTFAAWHAYCCLAVFAETGVVPAPGSLLPPAAGRAFEIGEHLLGCGRFLGRDGRRLVEAVTGRPSQGEPPPSDDGVRQPPAATFRSGDRVLLVRPGRPPHLVWTSAAAEKGL